MFDAIVLAGGTARRMQGADKPGLLVGGRSLLDLALEAVAGAQHVIVVGPSRATARAVNWRREDPIGGGPVAALAAAIDAVQVDLVVVLAADLPAIAPAVPALLRALVDPPDATDPDSTGPDAACLIDAGGRQNYLAAAWRTTALRTALAGLGNPVGASVRSLYADRAIMDVPDLADWGRDCDTWDDLAAARAREPLD